MSVEIAFRNLSVGFLTKFQQDGLKGIIGGHKKVPRIISHSTAQGAEQTGVKLAGAWVDGLSHTLYFEVETDSVEKLFKLFFPTLSIARAEVRPVEDSLALFKRRFAEEKK